MIPRTTERPNVIGLQVAGKYEEGRAQSAIYPGMALKVTADEDNPQQLPIGVAPNSVAGLNSPLRIADVCLLGNPDETKHFGMKITEAYAGPSGTPGEDDYYSGDLVPYFYPAPGDIFQARVAANTHLAIGTLLQVHSDGTFVTQAGSGVAKAQVVEEYDLSDPANEDVTPLIRVQAL